MICAASFLLHSSMHHEILSPSHQDSLLTDKARDNLKENWDYLVMVIIEVVVFWVVTLCGEVVGYQCLGGPVCLHLRVK